MSHIRLIISDIDGTILNDHHQIDPQLASLIPDLKREEIPFVLASARSPKGMAPIAKELGIEDCPMACYNGALIQKGEQVLLSILWIRRRPGTLSTGPTNTSLKFRSTSIVEKTG